MYLFLIVLIGLYFYKTGVMQQWIEKPHYHSSDVRDAKGILDLRLAKGEITIDEYNKLKSVL